MPQVPSAIYGSSWPASHGPPLAAARCSTLVSCPRPQTSRDEAAGAIGQMSVPGEHVLMSCLSGPRQRPADRTTRLALASRLRRTSSPAAQPVPVRPLQAARDDAWHHEERSPVARRTAAAAAAAGGGLAQHRTRQRPARATGPRTNAHRPGPSSRARLHRPGPGTVGGNGLVAGRCVHRTLVPRGTVRGWSLLLRSIGK